MATMDGHLYQPHHYAGFNDNRYQSYPQSSQGQQYPLDLAHYSTGSSQISLDYNQNNGHYDMRPAMQPRSQSYNGHTLQVMTESQGHHDHDPADYTAHPSRPQYQFRLSEQQQQHAQQQQASSSKHDTADDEHSSYDRSGEILPICNGFNRPLNHHEQERIAHLDRLKFFLATAPSRWDTDQGADPSAMSVPSMDPNELGGPNSLPSASHPALNRFLLPTSEYVSCVLWNGLYHITGTDIVRALVFRFEAFGRPVKNMKKFEEGIFSDLRNLKPGVDACLEEPKSPFLDLLFKYQCIRTQKKQKVFYWFSVPHDRLFLDALERDLKREKMGLEPTTVITGEPALSFTYDSKKSLYEQFSKAQGGKEGEGELEAAVRRADEAAGVSVDAAADGYVSGDAGSSAEDMTLLDDGSKKTLPPALQGPNTAFYSMFSLFEGSPTYKQRRKKLTRASRKTSGGDSGRRSDSEDYTYAQRRGESIMDMGVGYGPSDSGMNAADMFVAQAKGELGSANPDEREKERQRKEARVSPFSDHHSHQGHGIPLQQHQMSNPMVSRPLSEHRHNTYPLPTQSPYSQPNLRPHALTFPPPMSSNDMTMANVDSSQQKTKVFVCPLYSCCRFFKRMEHLKRHLRTHTMERPYQCQRCKKRFSRSDNLNQHIRTHTRADSEGGGSGYEDDQADVESEGMDELGVEGTYNPRAFPNGVADLQNPDMKMCEVEVPGHVQEIQGDEEGLVSANGQEAFIPPQFEQYGNFQLPSVSQWAGGLNAQSPMQQSSGQLSRSNTPGYAMRQSPPSAYGGSDSEFAGSLSAPSHKQIFDHATLYPAHLMESSGPGPIRRHRSMTPSLIKGETGRRALTSTSSEYGSPGRGYHPYAVPLPPSSYVSASSNSAQSSPASYPIPLDYPPSQAGSISGLSRSNSTHRSTSSTGHLQDQMHRILNLDQMEDTTSFHASPNQQSGFDEMYRSESPMAYPTGVSPQGLFTTDAPVDQFGSHTVDPAYFSGVAQPQHHVSL